VLLLALSQTVLAQAQTTQTSSEAEEQQLELDFSNPLSTLPQLIIRDSYTPANYGSLVGIVIGLPPSDI